MQVLFSTLNALVVAGCGGVLLAFIGVNLDKRPWWSWILAMIAIGIIWESAKAGIASSVAKKIGVETN